MRVGGWEGARGDWLGGDGAAGAMVRFVSVGTTV